MDEIIVIAAAIVYLAFLAGVIIYGLRFSNKQGYSRPKSTDRLLRFGIFGAITSFMVNTIVSAARSLYPDEELKKSNHQKTKAKQR